MNTNFSVGSPPRWGRGARCQPLADYHCGPSVNADGALGGRLTVTDGAERELSAVCEGEL
ncbi:hypothetical protein Taro_003769 [Colocasia esculenta]|uniref:Uncharacterized protein n=1 Tax=Colocasia esculenta TaxID=4460 RepID=A0A843TK86_COLES|nr:hypothetical protein [Colocasia esculenta]